MYVTHITNHVLSKNIHYIKLARANEILNISIMCWYRDMYNILYINISMSIWLQNIYTKG